MGEKIIIRNQTDRPMADILLYVRSVIETGRISGDEDAYCYHTEFGNVLHVAAQRNKASDTFTVWESGE